MSVDGVEPDKPDLIVNPPASVSYAMGLMITAMLVVPLMDVLSKNLSSNYEISPVTITFGRFLGQTILLALIIPPVIGFRYLGGYAIGINILRGIIVGCAVSLFFIAIKYLPLADAIAIFFVEPLILIVLSTLFLKEKIGWRRNVAAFVGFLGALLIIQPTYEVFGATSLLPLGTAFLFSIYILLSKRVGSSDHPMTMQMWAGLGGALACGSFLLLGKAVGFEDMTYTHPRGQDVLLMLGGIVVIATGAHLLIVMAFTKADASILAPFQYLEIVTMTIAGYVVFGDFPTPIKWLGIFTIIGSGLYIFFRERRLDAEARAIT
jgi:drug/metabolite transporter (DMT)-like permease